ncbi:MAG TPA: hypothetical protein VNI01_14875 [Elusimicrobiota bacterium]|nr:hypothetical protein [Elusimicrobiota bacterium]
MKRFLSVLVAAAVSLEGGGAAWAGSAAFTGRGSAAPVAAVPAFQPAAASSLQLGAPALDAQALGSALSAPPQAALVSPAAAEAPSLAASPEQGVPAPAAERDPLAVQPPAGTPRVSAESLPAPDAREEKPSLLAQAGKLGADLASHGASAQAPTAALSKTLGAAFDLSTRRAGGEEAVETSASAAPSAALRLAPAGASAASRRRAPAAPLSRAGRRAGSVRVKVLAALAAIALAVVATISIISLRSKPESAYDQQARQNAAAAAQYDAELRGPRDPDAPSRHEAFPEARSVAFEETKKITALSFDKNPIYTIPDIVRDFREHHAEGQVGILVALKTEFCANGSRACALTTAALEHDSPPDLARFKIYGAWVKNPKARPDLFGDGAGHDPALAERRQAWLNWSRNVVGYYDFEQGPGSNLFFINPNVDLQELERNPIRDMDDALRRGIVLRTDAAVMGFYYDQRGEVRWNSNLQQALDQVREAFNLPK